ncbi:MAG: UDP-N-acetylmuramate dehydrogenase [Candidatus Saccharimonadales bacterium]
MNIQENFPLSTITSFGTGGMAELLIQVHDTEELFQILANHKKPLWVLGSGANSLISDEGLPGTTIQLKNSQIELTEESNSVTVVVDAGIEWDYLIRELIKNGLWGLELTSGIPGSVGAAVVGNIAAYGQSVSDALIWVDAIDTESNSSEPVRLIADQLGLSYRYSDFQTEALNKHIITRAAFTLQRSSTMFLNYASALKISDELNIEPDTLENRRTIIMESRKRAGSLLDPAQTDHEKTAGSFFRNPMVSREQAEKIISKEEFGVSESEILNQNLLHSGDSFRISAAHVLLAAGFNRGQSWGSVRLHPEHVLKIENTGGATSQQIYNVAKEIIETVEHKLHVQLKPEVRMLGRFSQP